MLLVITKNYVSRFILIFIRTYSLNCDDWLLQLYLSLYSKSPLLFVLHDISVSTMCIYRDYCVYHYKSTELVSVCTLDIGL